MGGLESIDQVSILRIGFGFGPKVTGMNFLLDLVFDRDPTLNSLGLPSDDHWRLLILIFQYVWVSFPLNRVHGQLRHSFGWPTSTQNQGNLRWYCFMKSCPINVYTIYIKSQNLRPFSSEEWHRSVLSSCLFEGVWKIFQWLE